MSLSSEFHSAARWPSPSAARVRAAAGVVVVALGVVTGSLASAAPATHSPTLSATTAYGTDTQGGTSSGISGSGGVDADVATAALAAARALADAAPGTAVTDPHVVDELGYAPAIEQSLPANSAGDCSSPVPLPGAFEPACRVHDLGYDLLRVAHRHQTPIPPGLRADLDSLLGQQMRASCEGRTACTIMAEIAHAAVHLNTVRQGHGAPIEEALPW